MKNIILKLITMLFFIIKFFSLSYRYKYWMYRFTGFAFVIRNRQYFSHIGKNCFISSDIVLHNPHNISIGDFSEISKNSSLTTWGREHNNEIPLIDIRNNVSIGEGAHITACNFIQLNDNVLLGKYVTITDNSHGYSDRTDNFLPPLKREVVSSGIVIIESRVWIGDKVTILPGVRIGEGAIIGSNSVVTKDIPKYSVAVGIPAAVIKQIH
ncbi:TPA: DapH/DapD/GlmU-related protein [Photobacterium damselae subsp. damselae]